MTSSPLPSAGTRVRALTFSPSFPSRISGVRAGCLGSVVGTAAAMGLSNSDLEVGEIPPEDDEPWVATPMACFATAALHPTLTQRVLLLQEELDFADDDDEGEE
eukprot:1966057-Rhodomonas_salina.2